ncbi:phosphotransferase [Anaerotignum lactatifermentans]|uniref:Phosphotransferase n=1 Tax=Anaerotignum lactatifermentans TaxID=160404 RepID=A0ABS2G9G7_9FIRM|nr:phosphotransferase [Anaerotignum lactatifermentans]MBM6829135.1 phosphotransferase [Anaerotignum lactatifermentans]MBM6877257.1 phosphotransferase [Anaerotignum lactatifermentans]MBM6950630.1 phosphotransferase [Anaerotignum lactatifermentans]
MEDIYGKILWEGYGLKYYGGSRTRTGLVCKTDMGLRELKKARVSQREILFAHDVKKNLYRNGFSELCLFYTAVDGQPFFVREGTVYLLEEPMPSQNLEEEEPETFRRGAAVLGRMHRLSKGCHSPYGLWEENRLPEHFRKRRAELAKIKRRIDKKSAYTAMDLVVLRQYARFMEQAAQGEELLRKADYAALAAEARAGGYFCHNSFKGDHLRRREDGRIFVGGFEGCSADVPLLDLAAYLRRFMRKSTGTAADLAGILDAYQQERPLSVGEKMLLTAMAVFPDRFMRLMNETYNKRQVCVSPAMEEKAAEVLREEEGCLALRKMLDEIL